jgi:hypothetical protein
MIVFSEIHPADAGSIGTKGRKRETLRLGSPLTDPISHPSRRLPQAGNRAFLQM